MMKALPASVTLFSLCVSPQAAKAAWTYDFTTPPPPSFVTSVLGPPSPTFSSSVAGGILRLSDTATAAQGGAPGAAGFETSQSFADVRVEALLNPAGTSDDVLNVLARLDLSNAHLYAAGLDFKTGALSVVKVAGAPVFGVLSTDPSQGSQPALTDLSRSYYLRLDAIGNQLNATLFDTPGGAQLLHVAFTDTGAVGGPAYAAGFSGVSVIATGTTVDGTFDNLSARAVPEPSAAGASGMVMALALLRRRRSVAECPPRAKVPEEF